MDDLRTISGDTKIQIRLSNEVFAEVEKIAAGKLPKKFDAGIFCDEDEYSMTMAYSDWEEVLTKLSAHMADVIDSGSNPKEQT